MRHRTPFATAIVLLAAASAAAQTTLSFTRGTADFRVGTSPVDVAIADFNGDGTLDVASANNNSGNVSVLLGHGNGMLTNVGAAFPVGTPNLAAPSAIAVGDFNSDGKADLVVLDELGNAVNVLLNQGGTALFGAAISTRTGTAPKEYLDKMLAEPFGPFTFSPAGAAVYQLGPFGTAAKKLKQFDLKP